MTTAVIPPTRHHQLVTTDPVIHGRHFDDTVPPRAVGAKLLKRNLSDIAAMGGRPVAAVVSLALAPETSTAWLRGFYLGLAAYKLAAILEGIHYRYLKGQTVGPGFDKIGAGIHPLLDMGLSAMKEN